MIRVLLAALTMLAYMACEPDPEPVPTPRPLGTPTRTELSYQCQQTANALHPYAASAAERKLRQDARAEAYETCMKFVIEPTSTPTATPSPTPKESLRVPTGEPATPTPTPTRTATPTVTPTRTPTPPTIQSAVLELSNQARHDGVSCGPYPPRWGALDYEPGSAALTIDADLDRSAQAHAEYMAETGDYRHQTQDAILAAGGQGENIAYIGPNEIHHSTGKVEIFAEDEAEVPGRLVQGWINSPGHCHNLLQPQWRRIGIGVALSDDDTFYGVQVFGR